MELTEGMRYRVRYKLERARYEMVADFIGWERNLHIKTFWSLRPAAGTTTLDFSWIESAIEAPAVEVSLPKRVRVR
jgi:hypothetical protein